MSARRLFGLETEYALAGTDNDGAPCDPGHLSYALLSHARRLPHLGAADGPGIFLANGSRFYIDGSHPEMATPECVVPWDAVRFARAGDRILLRLVEEVKVTLRGRLADATVFTGNVDYSGAGTSWGAHESYCHRADPEILRRRLLPHLATRIVYTGSGGFNPLSAGVQFMRSPRAQFLTSVVSGESTSHRGIIHTRNEALAGHGYQREHLLCGESLRSDLAAWLRVGVTAVIVAMIEAGVPCGEDVELKAPLDALRTVATVVDGTCAVRLRSGAEETPIQVQRRYLEWATRHLRAAWMPKWAGLVCRHWDRILTRLEGGPDAVAATLDWAVKLAVFREHAQRRGFAWQALPAWTSVAQVLEEVRGEPDQKQQEARALLGPVMARDGLRWADFAGFLALRQELFELDLRFGQLGPPSLFEALDAAGVLDHAAPGVDQVDQATEWPPAVGRARVRARLMRQPGASERYACAWHYVINQQTGASLDLSNPFVEHARWRRRAALPKDDDDPTMFSRVMSRIRRGLREEVPEPVEETWVPSAIDLNNQALELRRSGRLDEAETLLRSALAMDIGQLGEHHAKVPHRLNNLSIVLVMQGRLAEAREQLARAWRLKGQQHDLTSGRILFVRLAVALIDAEPIDLFIGQLKTHLSAGTQPDHADVTRQWDIVCFLAHVRRLVTAGGFELLLALAAGLDNHCGALEALPMWCECFARALNAEWTTTSVSATPARRRAG